MIVALLGAGHVLSYVLAVRSWNVFDFEAGQCITNTDFEQRRLTAEPVDCDRADATMQLVSRGDAEASCPDGERDGTLYPVMTSKTRTLCLMWNLREGQCYASAPGDVTRPTALTPPPTQRSRSASMAWGSRRLSRGGAPHQHRRRPATRTSAGWRPVPHRAPTTPARTASAGRARSTRRPHRRAGGGQHSAAVNTSGESLCDTA